MGYLRRFERLTTKAPGFAGGLLLQFQFWVSQAGKSSLFEVNDDIIVFSKIELDVLRT